VSDIEFAKVTRTSNGATVRTVLAQLRLTGAEGDDDRAEPAEDAEVIQPLGIVSRPVLTATTEAVYVRIGDEIVVIGLIDKGAAVHDCEEGETQVHSQAEPACRTRYRASGLLQIESKAGEDIQLNGGTLRVARETDGVTSSVAMAAWITAISGYVNGIAPGTAVPPGTAIGTISAGAGAARVKA
jgi:hypothetical protein